MESLGVTSCPMNWLEMMEVGFRYDRWASERWIDYLPKLPESLGAAAVFQHILTAQRVWLTRCLSEEEVRGLTGDLVSDVRQLNEDWIDLLRSCDPEAYVSYVNTRGESFFNTVEQIVRHVLFHGVYHRGHLRGLAGTAGCDFPETDFIVFARSQSE